MSNNKTNLAVDRNGRVVDVLCITGGYPITATSPGGSAAAVFDTPGEVSVGDSYILSLTPDGDCYFKQGLESMAAVDANTGKLLKSGAEYLILVENGMDYWSALGVGGAVTINVGIHGRAR